MTHMDVSALGYRVRLQFDEDAPSDFIARVHDTWQDALFSDAQSADADQLLDVSVPTPGDEQAILERLSVDVTHAALGRGKGNLLMFHAAGVADDAGNVIAIVGPSGRGKTTASRFLGRHYAYVSDETIAIDSNATVRPYRKPLSIVREGRPKDQIPGSRLGLLPLPEAVLHLRAIVVLNRVEEAHPPTLERICFAEAVPELIAQMSHFTSLASPFEQLADLVDSVGGALRLTYSESEELLPTMSALFAGTVESQPVASGVRLPDRFSPELRDARLIPTASDAFDTGDHILVLVQRTVHVLGAIASEIWRGLLQNLTNDQITEAVVSRFGDPPEGDAAEFVRLAIAELVATGLLTEPRRPEGRLTRMPAS